MVSVSHPVLPPWPAPGASALGWQPSVGQHALFQQLFWGILSYNQQVNLTRITTAEDFLEKHLWDALCGVAPWLDPLSCSDQAGVDQPTEGGAMRVIDIGTGGGFPGLPVAIAQSNWQVALLDSTRKKIAILSELVEQLGLTNVSCMANRAETVAHQTDYRERFDLALVRAVGPASTCAEYAVPLLAVGGTAVLYRGQWTLEEEATLLQALELLGGTIADVRAVQTPLQQGMRHYVDVTKTRPTPEDFPRPVGFPAKHPLGQ